jgi:hypothetical protein
MKLRFYCDIPRLADAASIRESGLYARTKPPKWVGDAKRIGFDVEIPDELIRAADFEAPMALATVE